MKTTTDERTPESDIRLALSDDFHQLGRAQCELEALWPEGGDAAPAARPVLREIATRAAMMEARPAGLAVMEMGQPERA